MKIRTRFFLLASSVASAFALSACGNAEPTEREMFQAMSDATRNRRMFGEFDKTKAAIQKSGCEKIKDSTYKCGVIWKDGRGKAFPSITFTKVNNTWVVAL